MIIGAFDVDVGKVYLRRVSRYQHISHGTDNVCLYYVAEVYYADNGHIYLNAWDEHGDFCEKILVEHFINLMLQNVDYYISHEEVVEHLGEEAIFEYVLTKDANKLISELSRHIDI